MAQKGRHQQVAPKYRNKGVDNPLIQSGSNFLAFVWIFLLEDMLSDLNLKDKQDDSQYFFVGRYFI